MLSTALQPTLLATCLIAILANLARFRKLPPGWRAASCTGFFFFSLCKISQSVFTEFCAQVTHRQDNPWDDLMLQSLGELEGSAVLGQRPKSCHLAEDAGAYRSQGRTAPSRVRLQSLLGELWTVLQPWLRLRPWFSSYTRPFWCQRGFPTDQCSPVRVGAACLLVILWHNSVRHDWGEKLTREQLAYLTHSAILGKLQWR